VSVESGSRSIHADRGAIRPTRTGALLCYGAAASIIVLGVYVAFARFPGGFDWTYTVVSKLASTRQNPDGARWLAGALLAAVALLWPVTTYFGRTLGGSGRLGRIAIVVLRGGLIGGALLGIEGLFVLELSRRIPKSHEILALVTFLGFYGGVLGLYVHHIRQAISFLPPALMVLLPLCAVGVSQLVLYFDQRDLGWVETSWRELGVPFWLSFAFWQWLAVLFLGLGIGYLLVARAPAEPDTPG
jgi:hypothetical protein